MAIYHMSVKIHSRSTGASAVARAAYRAREALDDERTGERHDYSKRTDLDHAEILVPEDAPDWARDRSKLWNQVEAAERRKDAQVAREIQIGLPVELTQAERQEAVKDFLMDEVVSRGMVADVAFHGGDTHNPHAHVLLTTRRIGPEGFGSKERAWNDRAVVETWREEWASWANRYLERAGERIDHRTLEAQRDEALQRGDTEAAAKLDRAPAIHLGKAASMEARGIRTERGDELERIDDHNWAREDRRGGMRVAIDEATVEIRALEQLQDARKEKIQEPGVTWRPGENVSDALVLRMHERRCWAEERAAMGGEMQATVAEQRGEWRALYLRQGGELREAPGPKTEKRHRMERVALAKEHTRRAGGIVQAADARYQKRLAGPIPMDDFTPDEALAAVRGMAAEMDEASAVAFRRAGGEGRMPPLSRGLEQRRDRTRERAGPSL